MVGPAPSSRMDPTRPKPHEPIRAEGEEGGRMSKRLAEGPRVEERPLSEPKGRPNDQREESP